MKFLSAIDKYSPFLNEKEIIKIASVSKQFTTAFLPKFKEKISEKENELEAMKADKSNFTNEFAIGKFGLKAIEKLNEKSIIDYFKKDEVPNEQVLFIYQIFYQLINKEKDLLKVKDNNEFWKLIKDIINKNSEKGVGEYIKNELKNIDCSIENISKIYKLYDEQKIINPLNIAKSDNIAGLVFIPVREALEYIGIIFNMPGKTKKIVNNDVLQKYNEYLINKRKEIAQKLDKIISK